MNLPVLNAKVPLHIVNPGFEEVAHLEICFSGLHLCLDIGIGIIDDSQEHVEQNEEHEEDVAQEVNWTQESARALNGFEIKVA